MGLLKLFLNKQKRKELMLLGNDYMLPYWLNHSVSFPKILHNQLLLDIFLLHVLQDTLWYFLNNHPLLFGKDLLSYYAWGKGYVAVLSSLGSLWILARCVKSYHELVPRTSRSITSCWSIDIPLTSPSMPPPKRLRNNLPPAADIPWGDIKCLTQELK